MDFESFAKLWPNQLDLLSGPLLEGDDDDDMDNPADNELVSVQNSHSLLESSANSDFHSSLEADELRNEVNNKNRVASKSTIHTFCVSSKNSCTSVKKTGLGMVVYVGRKHSTRPDSDEEVDIETIDEELNGSSARRSALSYRAFSRQMLNVVDDKEILHEVPNVIFASDTDRETGLPCSSENARNLEMKCSAMGDEGQNILPLRRSAPSYHALGTQALRIPEDKEVSHEVPSVIFPNDTEKGTSSCKNSCDGTENIGTKCNTAVLQASDVDSLLEQFEASEGITSQEASKSMSSLPEDITAVDEKILHKSPGKEKDVSSYIIQKIKMSSVIKKGPILIPPSHQPKSKTKNSNQSCFEIRKTCRASSSSFPVNKECSSKNRSLKYLLTLDHDHDYCSNFASRTFCEKGEDVKSLECKKECEKDMNLGSSCFLSDKYFSCESVDSCHVKKPSEEEYFIPDAEFEVEISGSHVDINEEALVETSLNMSDMHCKSEVCANNSKAFCSAKSDSHVSSDIMSYTKSEQIGPIVIPSMKKQGLQSKTIVKFPKLDTSGSVLLGDSNLPGGKRKQDSSLTDSSCVLSKKSCTSLPSKIQSSPQMLCDEKIDILWKRTRSPCVDNNGRPFWKSEKQKQIEERRVVYVGKLPEGLKVNDLRECFVRFGPIQDISIHFRENGDNYGFVTFFNRSDAYEVVERGKLDPKLRKFDLCFGGRRQFCRTRYSDLDSVDEDPFSRSLGETDFDTLLQKAKAGSQCVKHSTSLS